MKKRKIFFIFTLLILLIVLTWAFRINTHKAVTINAHPRDYEAIVQEGILRVATEYNSISYFVYKDTIAGFNYELIQAFAHDKGLKIEIIPEMSAEKRLKELAEGKYDLIAYGILANSVWKDSLALTIPISQNKQVLVQRAKNNEDDSLYIQSQLDLAGKTIHVVKGSPSIQRIRNLSNEIGDTIYIKEIEKYGNEQLISLVAHGDINYAVCEESIAQAAADSLPQIDIQTGISFTQFYSWAMSKSSPALLDTINQWLTSFKQTKRYHDIYRKYYPAQVKSLKKK